MAELDIHDIPRADYAGFLDGAPHSAFHRLGWLDAIAAVYGLQIRLLGYFRANTLVAVTPLLGRRMGPLKIWGAPLRKCGTPPATPFCSPHTEATELLPHLRRWVQQQRLGFVQITVPGADTLETAPGARSEPLDNLELDLRQPLESLWRNLAQQKTAVRKAVRSGVRVHLATRTAMLDAQRELVDATYGRQGLTPNIPLQMYAQVLAHRTETGARVLYATHAGRTIASVWAFSDHAKCYYWDAAALAESRELNANHLLLWCLIRWAHKRGFATLDLVGTSTGGRDGSRPGIGRFKQSMGGRPVQYQLMYWHTPLMHTALTLYRKLNRARTALRNFSRHQHGNRT